MNLKKALLLTVPVVLAGCIYFGNITGFQQVFAKTRVTMGKLIEGHIATGTAPEDFEDESYYYIYKDRTLLNTTTYYFDKYEKIYILESDDSNNIIPIKKVIPSVDPEAEIAKQREEAALEAQKTAEKKTEDFTKDITKSVEQAIKSQTGASGREDSKVAATAVIKTDYFTCFTQDMMNLLASNTTVNYEIHYLYKGKRYVVVIPAGTDYSKLQDSNGYYGFRYLDSIFGGYEEGTK